MSKGKSILGAVAKELAGGKPARPWWDDPEKTIKKALQLALQDEKMQRFFLKELGKHAGADERFRRALLVEAKEPGKNKKGGTKRPSWWLPFILKNIEVAEKTGESKTRGVKWAAMHLNRSEGAIWNILREHDQ